MPAVVWLALLAAAIACGGVLRDGTTFDVSISERLERARTAGWNAVTHVVSLSASTLVVVGIAAAVVAVSLLRHRRDGVAVFAFAMIGEVVMFLTITAIVDRPRPDVERLDPAPPTSSFPSGHTYAAFVLWTGIAVLAHRQRWAPHLRRLAMVLAIVLPLAVGASRIYRGMHHPTDVIASLILGLLWVGALVMITARPAATDVGTEPRELLMTAPRAAPTSAQRFDGSRHLAELPATSTE